MSYSYVRTAYAVEPKVGARVQHLETRKFGVIRPEARSASHYVQVCFDGQAHALPCHPTALDYAPVEAR